MDQKNLPKRARYYRGMIDLNILEKGKDYNQLKKSYVIFICNYDPFSRDGAFTGLKISARTIRH